MRRQIYFITYNEPQPYAVAGWLVRLQNCVKAGVSGVRGLVGSQFEIDKNYFLSVGINN